MLPRFLRGGRRGRPPETLENLAAAINEVAERQERHAEDSRHRFHRLFQILERIADEETGNRRLLAAARANEEYERTYQDPDPLVSILLPTYDNVEGLARRALPSALAQTHANLEIVIVGDAAEPDVADAVASFGDSRIRWMNRTIRGPYPEEKELQWLTSGVPPFNDALELARGRWISPFADDDALRPDAIASVLAAARERRLELCYGTLEMHHRDGQRTKLGTFPPAPHEFGLQGGIFHSALRFLRHQPIDALFSVPSDWSLTRRMMRIGVRIGHLDHVVCDYHPSYRGETAEPAVASAMTRMPF
jgi:hypothetical protein